MKLNKLRLHISVMAASIFMLIFCGHSLASPICPVLREVVQPDGTVITVTTYGDEFFSWTEDENENVIVYDEMTGSYKYAAIENGKLVPTEYNAGEISLFSMFEKRVKREDITPLLENAERADYSQRINGGIQLMSEDDETKTFPLTHQKLLTLLIEFNDVEIEFDSEFWSEQMFSTETDALSMVNYWKENANGLDIFEPADTSDVETGKSGTVSYEDYTDIGYTIAESADGVVKVSLDMPHPSKTWDYENGLRDTPIYEIISLAVEAIGEDVDFKTELPHIAAVFAGYSISVGNGAGMGQIANHASLSSVISSNGTDLGLYAVVGEKIRENVPSGIGPICHELGHSVFFLPDLYMKTLPNGGYELNGIALYSLMSLGSWGSRFDSTTVNPDYGDPYAGCFGHVPPHLDPWSKIELGYVEPTLISEWDGDVNSINAEGEYNVLEIRSSADPNQYFLIENRQLTGFDRGLEKLNDNFRGETKFNGGIIIWHIDENVSKSNNNESEYHGFMQVERSTNTDGASAWQYLNSEGRSKLNAESLPNSNFHESVGWTSCSKENDCHPQTVESGISVEVLSESDLSMRVKVNVDDEYVLDLPDKTFSELFPDENFCKAVIDILEEDNKENRTPESTVSARDFVNMATCSTLILDDCKISDLSGIEYFSNLWSLGVCRNNLTEFTVPDCPNLYIVSCDDNMISRIDICDNEAIGYFSCQNNVIEELNIQNCPNLISLECQNNLLTELDLSKCDLLELYCYNNRLTKLDISNNQYLYLLNCYGNYFDNDPYVSIIGLEAVAGELGQPTTYGEDGKWFIYYPQNEIKTTPSPTPTPTLTDRIEFTNNSDGTVTAKLIFEKTLPQNSEDIRLYTAYKKDGVLKRVEIQNVEEMTALLAIPAQFADCDITVYVWDKGMKPLMAAQKMPEL